MKKILIFLLKVYKGGISPNLPRACRFTPTCSEYAMEALSRHGVIKGALLASYRLLRCNPFCRGGYDPVPDKFTFKRQNYVEDMTETDEMYELYKELYLDNSSEK